MGAAAGALLALLLASSGSSGAAAACRSDDDCSLLGTCTSGTCTCDPGWVGPDCGQADLLPFAGTGYINPSAASWGGRPVYSEGAWHLFATEIAHRCPLILFMNDSTVVRAEAASPLGPYTRKETVLPPFHHVRAQRSPFAPPNDRLL